MGGRSSGGTRNTSKPVREQIREFYEEVQNREYGSTKPGKSIGEERQNEFRRVYAAMVNTLKNSPENMDRTIVFAGGFSSGAKDPDKYVHSIQKLNAYQRILQNEIRNTNLDLKLGVIDENRAQIELSALKNLDATIQDRRKRLKETLLDI